MNDPPPLTPTHLGPGRVRPPHLRSASQHSPIRQRATDDLIANLSPQTTLEALRNPSGALKECLDASTAVEQAFAIKVAVAAKNIEQWLQELSAWPWPGSSGSAGFELPVAKRRRLSRSDESSVRLGFAVVDRPSSMSGMYMGSLLASEVATFENRLDVIQGELEVLELEEIKTQVLHSHIMPLSRPGTPMSGSRSIASLSAYAKMDDLTALITATIVQALPNLSKLIRLMNLWSIRLVVLRKTPSFLESLEDAEVALRSGWNVIRAQPREHLGTGGGTGVGEESPHAATTASPRALGRPTLSRKDSEVIKSVLERKVAKAGRDLDRMLDALEGREDTLPDPWIDRMDALEKGYGDWVASSERTIREAEYGELFGRLLAPRGPAPPVPVRASCVVSYGKASSGSGPTSPSEVVLKPMASSPIKSPAEPTKVAREMTTSPSPAGDLSQQPTTRAASAKGNGESTPAIKVDLAAAEQFKRLSETKGNLWGNTRPGLGPFDGSRSDGAIRRLLPKPKPKKLSLGHRPSSPGEEGEGPATPEGSPEYFGLDSSTISDGQEPDLPATPCPRRASDASTTDTVVFAGRGGSLDEFSSDNPIASSPDLPALSDSSRRRLPRLNDLDTPDLPPSRDRNVTLLGRKTVSPPSSPPSSPPTPRSALRSSSRSVSVTFNDMPTVTEIPDEEASPPETPLESSFDMYEDDDPASDMGSPAKPTTPSSRTIPDDQRLQQQISEILASVPARIKLASAPPAPSPSFNYLNPPDFAAPTGPGRKSTRPDQAPRSYSSMSNISASSRAATPYFTLAPAYGRTSRSSRFPKPANQEIKLYHLSRSNGEAPIKLFIRCVGENGERVMVRVGGGWADLGEYLKEYASHHGRRSQAGAAEPGKVAVQDASLLRTNSTSRPAIGSSPPSRPNSSHDLRSSPISMSTLNIRKVRRSVAPGAGNDEGASGRPVLPRTPLSMPLLPSDSRSTSSSSISGGSAAAVASGGAKSETPPSGGTATSARPRSSSRLSWTEEDASLGMAGPHGKKLEMTPESKAWVESVKERVRIASGERRVSDSSSMAPSALGAGLGASFGPRSASGAGGPAGLASSDQAREAGGRFGEMAKVGATKRLFRKPA